MTIIQPNGTEKEIADTSELAQAYAALNTAALRMGRSGYAAHLASKHAKRVYTPTAEHSALVEAMPKLLAGKITPEEAMSMLHEYDTLKQRLA